MKNILWFKEVNKSNIAEVGGKGASLGEMYGVGLPIPPGFCVTAQAYKNLIETTKIDEKIYSLLDKLDVENTDALYDASEKVQEIILDAKVPSQLQLDIKNAYNNMNVDIDVIKTASRETVSIIKAGSSLAFVAVRSSATAEDLPTASFAGQQSTYLNVKGGDELIKNVKKCWASLFTARAIYYRVKNNFEHRKVFISVIVQRMVNSDSAGVMFTINPSTNKNEIVIEAGYGLGEAVVGGTITPDRYVIDKKSLEITERETHKQPWAIIRDPGTGKNKKKTLTEEEGKKQKVSDKNLKILGELGNKIEEHYGIAQDIEFAIENEKVFIVQSRPVTTMKKTKEVMEKQEELKEKEVILKGLNAGPGMGSGKVKIIHSLEDLSKLQEGNVLVARMTNPDYVAKMKMASAIITDAGGTTCHAAIVGREMGLPVVVGTMKATQVLKDGDEVTVDGYTGNIYRGKVEIERKEEVVEEVAGVPEKIETVTEVKVNLDMPEYAEKAAKTGADGVGLLRCEFIILGRKVHPYYLIEQGKKDELVNNLAEDIKKIASAFKGKPVWYRTLDAPTDEFRHLQGGEGEPKEDNPMMGWRSIRRDLDQPELLKAQFEAIKKVHDQGFTNIGVMIPLVTDVEQVKKAKQYLMEIGLEPLEQIEFGVMVETPASIEIIEEICKEGIDFISFGTNDLTQFTLAVDRNNAKVQKLFDEMHPAVLKQIERVIKTCREYNVETSICGQAGSREDMVEWLVKKGIDSISANIDAVEKIKKVVYKTEKRMLLKYARSKE